MKTWYLKLTALSPLHIGSGEDYEPTNFIIENGYLYEFDEMEFYRALQPEEKSRFSEIVSQNAPDMLFKIHAFVKEHKKQAMEVAHNKTKVSTGIASEYERKIGRVVQHEGKGRTDTKKVFNQFQIMRSQRLANQELLYIPGSSLKGSISTALQEALYRQDEKRWEKEFKPKNPSLSPYKNLLVSDAVPIEVEGEIGFAINKERFEEDDQGPSTKIEAIRPGATLLCTVSTKTLEPKLEMDMEKIVTACNAHYEPNLRSLFDANEYIRRYLSARFTSDTGALSLGDGRFLVRAGRHSGARAVTIEGLRSIRVKVSGGGPRRKPNEWENRSEETTVWLYGSEEHQKRDMEPFGWLLCEVIDENEYAKLFETYAQSYHARVQKREQERLASEAARMEAERKAREEEARKAAEAAEREAQAAQEAAEREAQAAQEAARLASLSPVDRLIETVEITELVNRMRKGEIEDYEAIKVELAQKVKAVLQQNPKTWDKAKKKSLDRKEFIQGILGE